MVLVLVVMVWVVVAVVMVMVMLVVVVKMVSMVGVRCADNSSHILAECTTSPLKNAVIHST